MSSDNPACSPIHSKAIFSDPDTDHRSCDRFKVTYTPLFCKNARFRLKFCTCNPLYFYHPWRHPFSRLFQSKWRASPAPANCQFDERPRAADHLGEPTF
ncbi:hypothetical protein ACFX1Z_003565 [Malus domestica]